MGQVGWSLGIQALTERLVVLSLVYRCIGSTVHDTVNLVIFNEFLYGCLVSDVQLGHICIKISMLGILLLQQLHLVSQLAVTARNQYLHILIRTSVLLPCLSYSSLRACL